MNFTYNWSKFLKFESFVELAFWSDEGLVLTEFTSTFFHIHFDVWRIELFFPEFWVFLVAFVIWTFLFNYFFYEFFDSTFTKFNSLLFFIFVLKNDKLFNFFITILWTIPKPFSHIISEFCFSCIYILLWGTWVTFKYNTLDFAVIQRSFVFDIYCWSHVIDVIFIEMIYL